MTVGHVANCLKDLTARETRMQDNLLLSQTSSSRVQAISTSVSNGVTPRKGSNSIMFVKSENIKPAAQQIEKERYKLRMYTTQRNFRGA